MRQGFVEEGFDHRRIARRVHVGIVLRIYVRNSIIQACWISFDCLLESIIERNATSASFVKERGSWLACRILFGAGANACVFFFRRAEMCVCVCVCVCDVRAYMQVFMWLFMTLHMKLVLISPMFFFCISFLCKKIGTKINFKTFCKSRHLTNK